MRNRKKPSGVTIVIAMLIAVTIFCISGTVLCRSNRLSRAEELSYRALKQEYVRELRTLLEEKGYSDSGVVMNSITQADGERSCIITIHHRKIEALDNREKNALAAECQSIEVPVENCSVYFQ